MVTCAEGSRNGFGVRRFVETGLVEPDRERRYIRVVPPRDGRDQGGIQPAREEDAHGDIRNELLFDCRLEQVVELPNGVRIIHARSRFRPGRAAVAGDRRRAATVAQVMTARQFSNLGDAGLLPGHVFHHQEDAESVQVGADAQQQRMPAQCCDLGREHEFATDLRIVKRFLAELVASQVEGFIAGVVPGEREHPVDCLESLFHAATGQQPEQGLRVAVIAQGTACVLQFFVEAAVAVDLAVVDQRITAG